MHKELRICYLEVYFLHNKKKVLFINKLHPLTFGGAEFYMKQIGDILMTAGYDVAYATPNSKDLIGEDLSLQTKYYYMGNQGVGYWRDRISYFTSLTASISKVIDDFKPDLIIDNMSPIPAYPAYISCAVRNIPIVTLVHEIRGWHYNKYKDNMALRLSQPLIERTAGYINNRFISVGPSTSKGIKSIAPKAQIFEIQNSVSDIYFDIQRRETENPTVVVISRLAKVKNIGVVVKAWDKIHKLFPEASLHIAGAGSEEPFLQRLTNTLGLSNCINFEGRVSERRKLELLTGAWVYVLPTMYEGFGISNMEAMAAGVPVITTPVPGVVDYAQENVNALFCDPRNPDDFADRISDLVLSSSLREKLSRGGRRTALLYSKRKMQDVILETFDGLLRQVAR